MRRTRWTRDAVTGTTAPALLLSGCGGGGSDSEDQTADASAATVPEEVEPVRDGQLVVGLQSGIDGFLPFANRWGPAAFQIATSIYDPLVAWDENEQARPFLLESIEPEEDFTAWTLALREDITFHDGDDFDAEWAFVWSVQVHGVGQGSLPDVSAALPSHDGVTSLADIGKG